MTEWRSIVGFEGYYSVSSDGLVRNDINCKNKVLQLNHRGYLRVALYKKGLSGTFSVHRLVYEAFRGEIPSDKWINHKDGVKTNNDLLNLELVTRSENEIHAYRVLKRQTPQGEINGNAKLDSESIIQIKAMLDQGVPQKEIAAKFGVTQPRISEIKHGKSWGHVK